MKISQKGIDFIKLKEGFKKEAYLDTGGVWTIGYGTILVDGKKVVKGQTCTQSQAEKWLVEHIEEVVYPHLKRIKVPVNQNQLDALISFIYNLGGSAFSKSTLLRKLNSSDYKGAADEFLKWCFDNGKRIQGLYNRRVEEREMFLS